jgi:hypothetical protein
MKNACGASAGVVRKGYLEESGQIEAPFEALHAVQQFVRVQLMMRDVLEEVGHVAPDVDDRSIDADRALANLGRVGLYAGYLGSHRFKMLDNQVLGTHLLSPLPALRWWRSFDRSNETAEDLTVESHVVKDFANLTVY